MPRPERSSKSAHGSSSSRGGSGDSSGGMPLSGSVREDIHALNSSILLITQKMKYLVRNEKILGRNLIVLNKKIKALEDKMQLNSTQQTGSEVSSVEVEQLKTKLSALEFALDDSRSRNASKEELKEVKYVIDSINPLEFVTPD